MSIAVANILGGTTDVSVGLAQTDTNGASLLGTEDSPVLSNFLTSNPLPGGFPWGSDTAENTNPYKDSPDSGVTRYYDFDIRRKKLSPDGFQRDMLVINGQFPAPTIEANWGDTIQVTVHNNIDNPPEGTAIHWHGFLQKATPWYDGVPSVQQCPIAPGSTFTYRFKAELYGTTWYHSHYSAQYAGGLIGPLIVYGPKTAPYDIDIGPVFLTDWYHREYFKIVEDVVGTDPTKIIPRADNQLINGKMNYNCSLVTDGTPCKNNAGLAKFKFQPGKIHRLRLINAGADLIQKFSIDGHTLTVIANDFVPVKPYDTKIVTLGIGQRTDILVKGIGKATDSFFMRSNGVCGSSLQPNALAIIYYPLANRKNKPTSVAQVDTTPPCENDPLTSTVPVYPITPDPVPATTQNIEITLGFNSSGNFHWFMNNSSFRANFNNPLLLLAKLGNTSYPNDPQWNVYNFGSNKTIRVVVMNNTPATHPMHLHGHNMEILSVGPGVWNGVVTNPSNPQRRDVQLLPANSHMVWQIEADNPGVWPFHCHIAWHVSAGLYVNIMERPEDIKQMQIPAILAQTCRDWAAYTGNAVVEQIDSGL